LSPGQRIPNAEVAESPLQSPSSDAEVGFSVLSRRNEEQEEDHKKVQNLLLVEDLEFTTERGLKVFDFLLRTGLEVWQSS
jgi:hypothetical protein